MYIQIIIIYVFVVSIFFSFHLFESSWIRLNPVLIWLYPLQFTTQCIAITQNKTKETKPALSHKNIFVYFMQWNLPEKRNVSSSMSDAWLFASYYIHKIWYFHTMQYMYTHRDCVQTSSCNWNCNWVHAKILATNKKNQRRHKLDRVKNGTLFFKIWWTFILQRNCKEIPTSNINCSKSSDNVVYLCFRIICCCCSFVNWNEEQNGWKNVSHNRECIKLFSFHYYRLCVGFILDAHLA